MENNTNLSERIKQLIDYYGLSINKFSTKIGASNSYFNKMLKENSSIGSDRIEKILRIFPDISAEWLLTGKGSMFKKEEDLSIIQEEQAPYYTKNNKNNEIIEIQKQLLESQAREIKLLQEKIDRLESDKSIVSKTT